MANGWGGVRPGSGRKPKSDAEMATKDGRRRRKSVETAPARVLAHPSVPSAPANIANLPEVDEADAPNELNVDERKAWLKWAPHALANGTLTPATGHAFVLLCQNIVLERSMAAAPLAVGTPAHTAIKKLLDTQMLRFCLSPVGKPMPAAEAPAAAPANPLAKYMA